MKNFCEDPPVCIVMFAHASRKPSVQKLHQPSVRKDSGVIQRAIGFEIEVKNWHTWQPSASMFLFESYIRAVKSLRIPHKQKDLLLTGEHFTLTADRPTHKSVPEFVTDAFSDDPDGFQELTETFRKIQAMLHLMHARAKVQPKHLQPIYWLKDFGKIEDDNASFDALPPPDMHAQANVGIRLSKVPELFKLSGTYPSMSPYYERFTRIKDVFKPSAWREMESMRNAHDSVLEAVKEFSVTHGPSEDWQASNNFVGLCTFLVHYLECPLINYDSYIKGGFPVMARTDFAAMYELLPPEERSYFQQSDGQHFIALFEKVKFCENNYQPLDLKGLVFEKGARQGELDPVNMSHLTREQWLANITQGVDFLTVKGYPGPDSEKLELDTMGSWGKKFDEVTPKRLQAPILELRRIQYTKDIDELLPIASDIFFTVVGLNQNPE